MPKTPSLLRALAAASLFLVAATSHAAPVLMSAPWTQGFCEAWNQTPALADGLAGEWLHDDKGRGYKIVQMYRDDCGKAGVVELKIVPKDGHAHCSYGGAAADAPDFGVDFLMHATTADWKAMGTGDPGPMWAMMSGKLQFEGPKMVAMRAIEPFKSFLLLVGRVPYAASTCPAGAAQASAAP
jgi:putative sterol carrier protein